MPAFDISFMPALDTGDDWAADRLMTREQSLRRLIRAQARNRGLAYGVVWVVPCVIAVWAICIWLGVTMDLAGAWKVVLGGVIFLVSSGLGWVILQHISQQRCDTVECRLLREHGLSSSVDRE